MLIIGMAGMAGGATAATIEGFGSPSDAIPGGTVEDFESSIGFAGDILNLGGVVITEGGGSSQFTVIDTYAGLYNTTGGSVNSLFPYPYEFRFDFADTVDAFAFNFGAQDRLWTVEAFTSAGSLIESLFIVPSGSANDGAYFGVAGDGISYAILKNAEVLEFGGEYVLLDNLTYRVSGVPIPAAAWLFGSGLIGLVGVAKRKQSKA